MRRIALLFLFATSVAICAEIPTGVEFYAQPESATVDRESRIFAQTRYDTLFEWLNLGRSEWSAYAFTIEKIGDKEVAFVFRDASGRHREVSVLAPRDELQVSVGRISFVRHAKFSADGESFQQTSHFSLAALDNGTLRLNIKDTNESSYLLFFGGREERTWSLDFLRTKEPNHSTEPSPTSVTAAAGHPPRQP